MKEYSVSLQIKRSRQQVWQLVTDVENFPKYIKYLYGVKLVEPLKLGSHWSDWTTILYIPLPINHTNTKFEEGKVFEYRFEVPLGGWVVQRFEIVSGDNPTETKFTLQLNFPNKIARFFVMPILSRRWEVVMRSAKERIAQEDNERENN